MLMTYNHKLAEYMYKSNKLGLKQPHFNDNELNDIT